MKGLLRHFHRLKRRQKNRKGLGQCISEGVGGVVHDCFKTLFARYDSALLGQ